MSLDNSFLYVITGFLAGLLSGLIGIGGGTIIVPILIIFFGVSQKTAQGTTLAMLVPPVGILAAWTYYKQGYVDLTVAALLCAGFLIGAFLGAKVATNLSSFVLEKIFGVALLIIAIKMIFSK
jgi:uncharacterized protein